MKKIILLTLLMVSIGLSAVELNLEESVRMAIESNKSLQKAKDEVEKYRYEYNTVRGNLFPQVTFSGGYMFKHTNLPDSAILEMPSLSSMLDSTATENDNLIAEYLDNALGGFMPSQENSEYSLAGSIQMSQAIFLGGKLINGISVASKLYHLQEKRYYLEEQNIIFATKDLYYKTKLAIELAKIQAAALEFANLYYKQVNDMYTEGLVSEYDNLRAELEVKKIHPQVLEAEKNAQLALQSFANHLGLKNSELVLKDDVKLDDMHLIELEDAISSGLDNRMELELSAIGVEVSKVMLRYEKGNFLPNIAITADYNFFGMDSEKIESDDWGNNYSVGIGFSMPLFTGGANTYKMKKAKHTLHQSELDHETLMELVELDVRNSYLQWQTDLEKVDNQKQNQELAEMGLKIAQARYENQVSNQLELIDAQLQVKTAKLSYMNAQYAAVISYEKLLKAMGKTLK